MVTIPPQLAEGMLHWHGASGQRWLDALPGRVADLERRWHVRAGEPFGEHGAVSWVAPAAMAGGSEAVIKIFLVNLENEHEAQALQHYAGRGAVRVLRAEPGAMLLERLRPGTPLWDVEDDEEACLIAVDVFRELWRPAPPRHPFRRLADDAARWSREIPESWEAAGRPYEEDLARLGSRLALELGSSQSGQVVLHQDLHGGNILTAERDPWLAIDAKPLVGEREFDLASLIRDRRESVMRDIVVHRLDLLSGRLSLDRERARGWAIVHALAWGVDQGGAYEEMVACARWLADG
jgi:streptomycin 6-kinase